jgi:chemotaxis protein methyltransferase CheR
MAANLQLEQVTDVQLARYAELIYETAGIKLSPQKKMMLSNRLRRRLRANAIDDFDDYLELLKRLPTENPEWDAFLQEVSTHETFLFRDEAHWMWFQSEFLPEIVTQERCGKRPKNLRIWSAACSTGDEAFTVAACVADGIPDHDQWKIEIVGTDIGIGAVREAQYAVFDPRAMRLVPESMVRRFFDAAADQKSWKAKPLLSRWTKFRMHNLLDPLNEKPFDLIFVKNVLIYFDATSKKRALANILPLLAPGGALVTAAAEGVSTLVDGLTKVKPWLYRGLGPKTQS